MEPDMNHQHPLSEEDAVFYPGDGSDIKALPVDFNEERMSR